MRRAFGVLGRRRGTLSVRLLWLCVCTHTYTQDLQVVFSRPKQIGEMEAAVPGLNSSCDETVGDGSSASLQSQVNGAEPTGKRTVRRPAYWLEMRGAKNGDNKSPGKKGTRHSWLNATLFLSGSFLRYWMASEGHAAIQPQITSLLVLLMY